MHVEVFVEEASVEAALRDLLLRLLGEPWTFRFHVFQGKLDLLGKLPNRLRAYSRWIPLDWRVIVLVDEDRGDCEALKDALERAAEEASLSTKTGVGTGPFHVLNRVAVEELEAWFFGDVAAVAAAYPRVPATLARRAAYRDPDAIRGGTWEALERVLQRAGYYAGGMPKIEVARNVSAQMDPARNSSPSFRTFVAGVRALAEPF